MKNLFLVLFTFYWSSIAFAQNKRVVIEPSKEYVQHLNAAKSHKIDLIKNDKLLNKYINQG